MKTKDEQDNSFESAVSCLKKQWAALQDEGVDYDIVIPPMTLGERFADLARRDPDKTYVIDWDGQVYSYGFINGIACKIAQGMAMLGIQKGDRAALYLPNCMEFVAIAHACFKLGVIIVNGNPFDTAYEMAGKITDSGARLIFYARDAEHQLFLALDEGSVVVDYLVDCRNAAKYGRYANVRHEVMCLAQLVGNGEADEVQSDVQPDDIATLQYTGGTTGVSKGCCITHRNYLTKALGALEFYRPVLDGYEYRIAVGIPMSHAYGFTQAITGLLANGGSMVLMKPKPSIEDMLVAIERYHATAWPAIPLFLNTLAKREDLLEAHDISSLRSIVCGAAPLPVSTIMTIEKATGGKITEGYGLTECVSTVTGMPFGVHRPGMVGIPFPNIEVLVVDVETGKIPCSTGQTGEIIVRSPQVMRGYWNHPEESSMTLRDGWLYTGDAGYFDEDGILGVSGRLKDLILVSGFNVYPREIDEVLMAHHGIAQSQTIGVPDPVRGEAPASFVVVKEGFEPSAEELRAYMEDKLTHYKHPRHYVFVDSIPKTKNGKPDCAALRDLYDSQRAGGVAQ